MVLFVGSLSIHKQKTAQGWKEEEIFYGFVQHLVFVLFLLLREGARRHEGDRGVKKVNRKVGRYEKNL
jgi:hypothetical protein